jgi:hypothetical protein
MIRHPKPGDRVVLHYRASVRPVTPHGKRGVVVLAARPGTRPRNVLVKLNAGPGTCGYLVVPAGNLVRA